MPAANKKEIQPFDSDVEEDVSEQEQDNVDLGKLKTAVKTEKSKEDIIKKGRYTVYTVWSGNRRKELRASGKKSEEISAIMKKEWAGVSKEEKEDIQKQIDEWKQEAERLYPGELKKSPPRSKRVKQEQSEETEGEADEESTQTTKKRRSSKEKDEHPVTKNPAHPPKQGVFFLWAAQHKEIGQKDRKAAYANMSKEEKEQLAEQLKAAKERSDSIIATRKQEDQEWRQRVLVPAQ